MNFTDDELALIRTALVRMQAQQISAFSAKDPFIDALIEKMDAPVEAEPEPAPAKKSKK